MKLIKQINNVFFYKNKNDILLSFTVIFFSISLIYLGIDHQLFSYNKEKFYLWIFLITTCIFFCIFFFPKEKFTNIETFLILYLAITLISSVYYNLSLEWFLITFIVLIINLNHYSKKKNYLINSIIFCNFFIFLIVAYSFYVARSLIFTFETYYGIITHAKYEGIIIPRSSGLSRSLAYILLTLFALFLTSLQITKVSKKNIFLVIILIPIAYYIYKLHSRGSLFCLIFSFYILFNTYLFVYKIKIYKILFFNLIMISIAIYISMIISFRDYSGLDLILKSSGRFESWLYSITNINPLLFGYGLQADRNILELNISNLFLYSYLSAGLIGLLFIVFHMISILINLINFISNHSIIKKNFTELFIFNYCILIFPFFSLRSLVENSFAIVSLDFVIWLTLINSIIYLKNYYEDKKNNK